MSVKDEYYRRQIVDIGQRLTARGVVGTFEGNISVIDREAGRMYITPSGQSKEMLTPEMVIITDLEGNYIDRKPGLKSSSETVMHALMYEMRPDMSACIHCHAPFCTAFAINNTPIRTDSIAEVKIMFNGEIPVLPFGEPGTAHLVDGYKDHMDKDVVLLANHGLLVVGKDLIDAYGKTVTIEMVAKTLFISRVMGENAPIPADELKKLDQWAAKQQARA